MSIQIDVTVIVDYLIIPYLADNCLGNPALVSESLGLQLN